MHHRPVVEAGAQMTSLPAIGSVSTVSSLRLSHFSGLYSEYNIIAFSAMTLLVGRQEGHPACKKLSGGVLAWLSVRCRLAYGPADATATHCLLLQ